MTVVNTLVFVVVGVVCHPFDIVMVVEDNQNTNADHAFYSHS
jgi:hypothetical protein